MGRYAEALQNYNEALKIGTAALGPEHPDVATTLNSIGLAHDVGSRSGCENGG
jgi:hypothetical protein